MPDGTKTERAILDDVVHRAAELPDFTEDEIEELKKVADAWRGLEALGQVAGVVKRVLMWIGWAVAFYLVVKAGVIDFIKGAVGAAK